MIRLALAVAISAVLISGTAEARRRVYYRIAKPVARITPPPTDIRTVRIIPIVRWPLWCERIGGLDCPER